MLYRLCIATMLLAGAVMAIPTPSMQYTLRIDLASTEFTGLEDALAEHTLTNHVVTAETSSTRRHLQAEGASLVITYTVQCGAACAEVTDSISSLASDSDAATTYAAGIIDAINAHAALSGFSNVVISNAADVASSITVPDTVAIVLPAPEPASDPVYCAGNANDYRGTVAVTVTGRTCQDWAAQTPHSHSRTHNNYPEFGLDGEHNYCRNPDGEATAWCYTTDPASRWELCDVGPPNSDGSCPPPPPPPPPFTQEYFCTASEADYRGTISTTVSGRTCQAWAEQTPHSHTRTHNNYPEYGLSGEHNYCRNPDGWTNTWCYTTDPATRWENCDIGPVHDCDVYCEADASDYVGVVAVTQSGRTCQQWAAQTPHSHTRTPNNYPEFGLEGEHNYCRNPDGEPTAWCYTTDPTSRWELCDVGAVTDCERFCESTANDYRGTIATTVGGYTCMYWAAQSPHSHTRTPHNYPEWGLTGEHNYCRNPDGWTNAWCYTTDPAQRWDNCDVGEPASDCFGSATLADWEPAPETPVSDIVGIEAADLAYDASSVSITLDADLSDWGDVPFLAQTPFRTGNEGSGAPWVEFEEFGGGIHNGIDDQASAWALGWATDALYVGVKVIDDTHQNPNSGWAGDSVQLAFTNEARDLAAADMHLYNYGLADDGNHHLNHEQHPCPSIDECTEAAMQRFEETTTTVYEIKLPVHSLGVDSLASGYRFGFAICVNDGDTDGTGSGQKGWSGWGPYAIVHNKNSASCGLVTLV